MDYPPWCLFRTLLAAFHLSLLIHNICQLADSPGHRDEVVGTHAAIPEFPQWEHQLSNQNYILSVFSPRWIQPKRKGCPTTPSHPEVIFACSSLPKLKSCFCCYLRTAHPPPCFFPCAPCMGRRKDGRVSGSMRVCVGIGKKCT